MKKIFVSHSSLDNEEAEFLKGWLYDEGWAELFLDFDAELGIKAGSRWQHELGTAMRQCDAVLILLSENWVASHNCRAEFNTASLQHKPIVACIVKPIAYDSIPSVLSAEWQMVDLTESTRDVERSVKSKGEGGSKTVAFSSQQLRRLKIGLQAIGVEASYFSWPPKTDPMRSPYPGLTPLGEDDAGIYFGRDGKISDALKLLRRIRADGNPAMMVVLGASGAGKSSFLRAGLLPRLKRDDRHNLVLPVVRPTSRPLTGSGSGFASSLVAAFSAQGVRKSLDEIEDAVLGDAVRVRNLLLELVSARPADVFSGETLPPPSIILPIDQAEELIFTDDRSEAARFLAVLEALLSAASDAAGDDLQLIVILTIRTDQYDRFQSLPHKVDFKREDFSLPPMPIGEYGEVIRGPVRRYTEAHRDAPAGQADAVNRDGIGDRGIEIEEALVDTLLVDIQAGGARDSLPLLAFTLRRLFERFGSAGNLTLEGYQKLGGIRGSITLAIERVMELADAQPGTIPTDRTQRLVLLKRGLIPWLAGIDPETQQPRRRIARLSEIPDEARPLIDLMTQERLLSRDRDPRTGETTIEPAHEALLRQWNELDEWLREGQADFAAIEGVRRGAMEWAANGKQEAWVAHRKDRLKEADKASAKPDFRKLLEPTDLEYLDACLARENAERARLVLRRAGLSVMSAAIVVALAVAAIFFFRADVQRSHALAAQTLARSKDALQRGEPELAAELGSTAFEEVQDEETRSNLLNAAIRISPYLNLAYRFKELTPVAIGWKPDGTLAVATREGRLLAVGLDQKLDIDGQGQSLPVPAEPSDGMPSSTSAIFPISDGLMIVSNDARMAFASQDGKGDALALGDLPATSLQPRGVAVDASPDGNSVVAVTATGGVIIYRCSRPDLAELPSCAARSVEGLKISAATIDSAGTHILAASEAGDLIDISDSGPQTVRHVFQAPVGALKLSADGRFLAAADTDGKIFLFDRLSSTPSVPVQVANDSARVAGLSWSRENALGYLCTRNQICLLEADATGNGKRLRLAGHTSTISQLAWSPDGEHLASISVDNSLRIWQRKPDSRVTTRVFVSPAPLSRFAVNRQTSQLAIGDEKGGIFLLNRAAEPHRWVIAGAPERRITSLGWNATGGLAALFEKSGFVAGKPGDPATQYRQVGDAGEMRQLTWVGDKWIALMPVASSLVQLVDPDGDNSAFTLPKIADTVTPWTATSGSDGRSLFVSYVDGSLRRWDIDAKTATLVRAAEEKSVNGMRRISAANIDIRNDNKAIAFGEQNGNVNITELGQHREYTLETGSRDLKIVAFSPSGQQLAALSPAGEIYIWQVRDGIARLVSTEPVLEVAQSTTADDRRKAVWLGWIDEQQIAVATEQGSLIYLSLSEDGWRERIRQVQRYSH